MREMWGGVGRWEWCVGVFVRIISSILNLTTLKHEHNEHINNNYLKLYQHILLIIVIINIVFQMILLDVLRFIRVNEQIIREFRFAINSLFILLFK